MITVDSHTHLMQEPFQYLTGLSADRFMALLDEAEIDVAVVFTLVGLIRDFREHNDELARVLASYPGRLVGLGSVNPWYGGEALEEVKRCFEELGFAGLKLHPWFTGFLVNSDIMDPICEMAADSRKPIFIHTGTPPGSAPLQVGNLASRHPEVLLVMGHMGLPDLWWEAVAAAKRHANLYLETAGAHSLSIKRAVEILGSDRVLFGSDSPFGGWNNVYFQREKIAMLGLPKHDLENIMGLNASRIFNIQEASQV